MSVKTAHTSWETAFVVEDCGLELGRIWYEPDTDWTAWHSGTDQEYDFLESIEEAVELLQEIQTLQDAA